MDIGAQISGLNTIISIRRDKKTGHASVGAAIYDDMNDIKEEDDDDDSYGDAPAPKQASIRSSVDDCMFDMICITLYILFIYIFTL